MPMYGGGGGGVGGENHFWGVQIISGGCKSFLGVCTPPPRKSVPENTNCKNCVNKSIKVYIM